MNRKLDSGDNRTTRRTVTAGLGASVVAGIAPFNILRAQDATLKVGVLLPRSGAQAGIGQDCQRGVNIAAGLLKELGMPPLQIMNGDTETSVEGARPPAQKKISDRAPGPVGAFHSGPTTAIAQVARAKRN